MRKMVEILILEIIGADDFVDSIVDSQLKQQTKPDQGGVKMACNQCFWGSFTRARLGWAEKHILVDGPSTFGSARRRRW